MCPNLPLGLKKFGQGIKFARKHGTVIIHYTRELSYGVSEKEYLKRIRNNDVSRNVKIYYLIEFRLLCRSAN